MTEPFNSVLHLFRQLNEYRIGGGLFSGPETLHHSITELGIVAHGHHTNFGTVLMNPDLSASSLASDSTLAGRLRVIGQEFLTADARVTFFSCAAAAGGAGEGSNLLRALSEIWPGRTVVGFVTYGYVSSTYETAAGNITNTLVSFPPMSPPVGYPRFDVSGPAAAQARSGGIADWPDPNALWLLYQTHNPSGASEVRQRAERRRVNPLIEYASTAVAMDVRNPNLPQRPEPVQTAVPEHRTGDQRRTHRAR